MWPFYLICAALAFGIWGGVVFYYFRWDIKQAWLAYRRRWTT